MSSASHGVVRTVFDLGLATTAMSSHSTGVFLLAALVLLLTPGPSVLFVVARSIDQGVRAGLASVVGLAVGGTFHVAAAALGLSAILVTSAVAFSAVKYIGAAYLIYLGIRTLAGLSGAVEIASPSPQPLGRVFREAIVVQILNPKAALFFFAFLPQFVDPGRGSAVLQVLLLGGMYHGLALITDSAYAIVSGKLALWVKRSARVIRLQRSVSGMTYIGLGLATLSTGHASAER